MVEGYFIRKPVLDQKVPQIHILLTLSEVRISFFIQPLLFDSVDMIEIWCKKNDMGQREYIGTFPTLGSNLLFYLVHTKDEDTRNFKYSECILTDKHLFSHVIHVDTINELKLKSLAASRILGGEIQDIDTKRYTDPYKRFGHVDRDAIKAARKEQDERFSEIERQKIVRATTNSVLHELSGSYVSDETNAYETAEKNGKIMEDALKDYHVTRVIPYPDSEKTIVDDAMIKLKKGPTTVEENIRFDEATEIILNATQKLSEVISREVGNVQVQRTANADAIQRINENMRRLDDMLARVRKLNAFFTSSHGQLEGYLTDSLTMATIEPNAKFLTIQRMFIQGQPDDPVVYMKELNDVKLNVRMIDQRLLDAKDVAAILTEFNMKENMLRNFLEEYHYNVEKNRYIESLILIYIKCYQIAHEYQRYKTEIPTSLNRENVQAITTFLSEKFEELKVEVAKYDNYKKTIDTKFELDLNQYYNEVKDITSLFLQVSRLIFSEDIQDQTEFLEQFQKLVAILQKIKNTSFKELVIKVIDEIQKL